MEKTIICTLIGLIVWINLVSCDFPLLSNEYARIPPLYELDDFDRCMLLESEALYCTFEAHIITNNNKKEINNFAELIQRMSQDKKYFLHNKLKRGICLPISCANLDKNLISQWNNKKAMEKVIAECYNKKLQKQYDLTGTINDINCMTAKSQKPVSNFTMIVGLSFLFYIGLVLFATLYEGIGRYRSKEDYDKMFSTKWAKFIACFSLAKSWHSIFKIDDSEDGKALSGIQGIRFLTMVVLMMLHITQDHAVAPVASTMYLEKYTNSYITKTYLVLTTFQVQAFFVIAALLQGYHFFLMIDNCKKVNFKFVLLFLLNRYLRIAPCLMVTLLFITSWLYYIGSGPYWHFFIEKQIENCYETWWANVLYVNNYVTEDKACFVYLWYLAADVQLYIVNLIVLTLIWRFRKHTKLILLSSLIIACAITGSITYYHNYDMVQTLKLAEANYYVHQIHWYHTYYSTESNLGGGIIGLIFGYYYYKHRGNKVAVESKTATLFWWAISCFLIISPIFIGTIQFQEWYIKNRFLSAVYAGVAKNMYGLGIGFVIFGTSIGMGWAIKWLLQWTPLYILGKLCFCSYIVHKIYSRVKVGSLKHTFFMDEMLCDTFGTITISFYLALLLCLFVEMPFISLQKLLIPQVTYLKDKSRS